MAGVQRNFGVMGLFVVVLASVASALYTARSAVKVLTADQFQAQVKNSNEPALVEFFAAWCGHCKAFASEYEKAAAALKGVVKVVAVEDQEAMGSEGVQGFPTVKFYKGKGNGVADFSGARNAAAVTDFALQQLSTLVKKRLGGKGGSSKSSGGGRSDVVELDDRNFDDLVMKDDKGIWFVEFYAPWCGHCKALAPTWDKLASELKGKVKVGKVDATANSMLAKRHQIQGFPTIRLFPGGPKSDSSSVLYQGGRDLEDLVKYAMGYAADLVKSQQLLSQDMFDEECKKGVCVVAFLPHLLDSLAVGRKKYIKELDGVAKASGSAPVKFFWVQGGDQFDMEEQLHLQFGWPALVAISVEKAKYAIHRGDFSTSSMRGFITALTSGRASLEPLPEKLKKFATAEAWDGKEASVPTEEVDDEL